MDSIAGRMELHTHFEPGISGLKDVQGIASGRGRFSSELSLLFQLSKPSGENFCSSCLVPML